MVRWCPICDGYEVSDKAVALLATARDGYKHALFLRTYTRRLTLFIQAGGAPLTDDQRRDLEHAQIRVIDESICRLRIIAPTNGVEIETADDEKHLADVVYPMVGCAPRIQLLKSFKARTDENDMLWVDEHQQTSIPGLYAAGDIVHALNQMSVGVAHATTAATAIHNGLRRNYR